MGAKVRIEFLSEGFHEVINQPSVQSLVRSTAQAVATRAGHGADVRVFRGNYGGGRPVAIVKVRASDPREFERAKKALEGAL